MRVITEEQLLARKREIKAKRRALRREDRRYAAEEMVLDGWLAELVDVEEPAAPEPDERTDPEEASPPATETISDPDPPADTNTASVFVRQPASEDSPVSKVQIPVLSRVKGEPGMLRIDVQREVAEQVGTSVQSVRESVRRMIKAGKLQQVGERLYPADMKVESAVVPLF